jgi:hypothetical protein
MAKQSEKRECRQETEKYDIEKIESIFEESDRIWGYRNITKKMERQMEDIAKT